MKMPTKAGAKALLKKVKNKAILGAGLVGTAAVVSGAAGAGAEEGKRELAHPANLPPGY